MVWSLCAAHVETTSTLNCLWPSRTLEVSFFSKMSSSAPVLPPAQAVTISEEQKAEWKETFTEVRIYSGLYILEAAVCSSIFLNFVIYFLSLLRNKSIFTDYYFRDAYCLLT